MSYEKYLKYKSKYLNLKAQIHNKRLINQNGGANSDTNSDGSLKSLGTEPDSIKLEESPSNKSLGSLGTEPDSINTPTAPINSPVSPSSGSVNKQAETININTPAVAINIRAIDNSSCVDHIRKKGEKMDLLGGKKLVRKDRDEFSSEYDTTESSLLSFSSVESSESDYA